MYKGKLMAAPTGKDHKVVPFFCIPNSFWDSALLNIYDKAVYCTLARCGPRVFPSLDKISKTLQISRMTVIKSLKKLEKLSIINRFKLGKKVYYKLYFEPKPDVPHEAIPILYSNIIGTPGILVDR